MSGRRWGAGMLAAAAAAVMLLPGHVFGAVDDTTLGGLFDHPDGDVQSNGDTAYSAISADGRYLAFQTRGWMCPDTAHPCGDGAEGGTGRFQSGDYGCTLPADEIQSVVATGGTGGFFLEFDGQVTGEIFFDNEADDLELELEAFEYRPGDVSVNGGPLQNTPLTVEFTRTKGYQAVPEMQVINEQVDDANPVVTTTQPGTPGVGGCIGAADIFLRDMQMETTIHISTTTGGRDATQPSISDDGCKISYWTDAQVAGATQDPNAPGLSAPHQQGDIYVADVCNDADPEPDFDLAVVHELASADTGVLAAGSAAGYVSDSSSISGDGQTVVFSSDNPVSDGEGFGPNLTGDAQTYVRNLSPAATTRLVSINAAGTDYGNGRSGVGNRTSISYDGSYVAFPSEAPDLTAYLRPTPAPRASSPTTTSASPAPVSATRATPIAGISRGRRRPSWFRYPPAPSRGIRSRTPTTWAAISASPATARSSASAPGTRPTRSTARPTPTTSAPTPKASRSGLSPRSPPALRARPRSATAIPASRHCHPTAASSPSPVTRKTSTSHPTAQWRTPSSATR